MATTKLRVEALARRTVLSAVAVAAMTVLAACSGTTAPTSSGAPSGTLQILVSSADASDAAFKAVNGGFEKKYPKIKVVFSSVPNASYAATKSSRLTAGNVDVFVVNSFRELPAFAKDSSSDDVLLAQSGGLLDLTKQPFMAKYTKTVLDTQAIGGKQYAVPTGLSYATGVYYNKTLFEKDGLTVPTTWGELEKVMSTLKAKGVTPFGIGGKDIWPAGVVGLGIVAGEYPTAADKAKAVQSIWKGTTKLTDPVPEEILTKTEEIYQNAQPNFAGTGYADIPTGFAAGDYAMTVDGTWNAPVITAAVGSSFDIGYFPLPGSDDAKNNALLNGKIELQLAVPANAKNKTAALAWLNYFSTKSVYTTFLTGSGFTSAQPGIASTPFLDSIKQYTTTFEPGWDSVWVPNTKAGQDAVYPFNFPAMVPLGTSTPEQAAQASQTAWSAAF
jgi:raffinose/stachyose/melibiose transport system substrate-binding protein